MWKRIQLISSLLVAISAVPSLHAATPSGPTEPVTLSWDTAGAVILGHKIQLVLPNGAVVEGKVLSLNSVSLDLQISKTSDQQIQPKGNTVIPKTAVHTLKLRKPQKKWRIILTSVGVGAAIPLWALASYSYNEVGGAPPPPLAAAIAIGGAAGYLGGWALDSNHDVTITIP